MPSHTLSERRKRGLPSPQKARKILRDDSVKGNPLSDKQKGLFGVIASGKRPTRIRRRQRG